MRINLRLFLLTLIISSCGTMSGYKLNQHIVYARALTDRDKVLIKQLGETELHIKLMQHGDTTIGMVRALPATKENMFNFVEIGEWYEDVAYRGNGTGRMLRRTRYDSAGNILAREAYTKPRPSKSFSLNERWTSEKVDGKMIQHIDVLDPKDSVTYHYDLYVEDFKQPKSDILKTKIKISDDISTTANNVHTQ